MASPGKGVFVNLVRRLPLVPAEPAQRRLAAAFFVNSLGTGAYSPIALIFLIKVAHWSPTVASLALSTAGLGALFSSLVTGWAADRMNPRALAAALFVCQGISMSGLCVLGRTGSYAPIIALLIITSIASNGSRPVWGVLISDLGTENRVELRAKLRAISNIAIAAGGLLAGVGFELGSGFSYECIIFANALSFFIAAMLLPRVPRRNLISQTKSQPRLQLPVLRDIKFVIVSCINIVLSWQYSVMTIALPIWVILHTAAPHWVIGAVLAVNALFVVVFQVPASRKVRNRAGTASAVRFAGTMFLLACVGFGVAGRIPPVLAIIFIGIAAVVQSAGEVFHASASFEIPYALAPSDAVGLYQGVFETAFGASVLSAPVVLTFLCSTWGLSGWLVLGALLMASGFGISSLIGFREDRHLVSPANYTRRVTDR
jgi:MFS family permease